MILLLALFIVFCFGLVLFLFVFMFLIFFLVSGLFLFLVVLMLVLVLSIYSGRLPACLATPCDIDECASAEIKRKKSSMSGGRGLVCAFLILYVRRTCLTCIGVLFVCLKPPTSGHPPCLPVDRCPDSRAFVSYLIGFSRISLLPTCYVVVLLRSITWQQKQPDGLLVLCRRTNSSKQ